MRRLFEVRTLVDEEDFASINEAVAIHQNARIEGEHILPDGDSETLGAVLAEICRDWIEYRKSWKPTIG